VFSEYAKVAAHCRARHWKPFSDLPSTDISSRQHLNDLSPLGFTHGLAVKELIPSHIEIDTVEPIPMVEADLLTIPEYFRSEEITAE
jgi:hypothetical protein